MIILSDCLSRRDDEGYVKIASKIHALLRKKNKDIRTISINDAFEDADKIIYTKTFIDNDLRKALKNEDVLFLSPGANSPKVSIKLFILSLYCKSFSMVFVQYGKMKAITRFFMKLSKVKIICLAKEVYDFYSQESRNEVFYLKTGVDKNKYVPVSIEEKIELRKKYGFSQDDKIILHVGHLKKGRNIGELLKYSNQYKVLLLTSSSTDQDEELKEQIKGTKNVVLIDSYIDAVEEIYQLSDCYVFPVVDIDFCIGVPLSVLEACACSIPVLTTSFGELKQIKENEGFVFDDFRDENKVLKKLGLLTNLERVDTRILIKDFDWEQTISGIERIVNKHE